MRFLGRNALGSGLQGLINLGVAVDAPHRHARWVQSVNVVTVGTMIVNNVFAGYFLLLGHRVLVPVAATNLLWNMGYIAALWINHRGRTRTAAWVLLATAWANTIVPAMELGLNTGLYLFLVLVPLVGVLLTGPGDKLWTVVVVPVGVALFALAPVMFTATPLVLRNSRVEQGLFIGSALGVGILGSLFGLYYRWLVDKAESALSDANQRSEQLLLNILPAQVAQRLKDGESPIGDRIDDVTVLFADLVGSTSLAERLSPDDLVACLDEIFSAFDDLADAHGMEKITSIGDGYLAVAGLPVHRPDHMAAAAYMALDMREALGRCHIPGDIDLEMRLGLASGSVVAGVIGKRKFRYDVWGDTVNLASRMESHGLPGMIHVTKEIRAALDGEFVFVPRGLVHIKGKGELETFFLERSLDARSVEPGGLEETVSVYR